MHGSSIATANRVLWRMLERRGVDPKPLFVEAGLDPKGLSNSQVRYPRKNALRLWARTSELVNDPSFGLTIAEVWQPTDFHALGCAFMASTTLRNALNRLVRYHAVVDEAVRYSLVVSEKRAILSYRIEHGELEEPAILEDTHWAVVLNACRRVYDTNLDPLSVTFLHSEPGPAIGKFYGLFRCPMQFGAPVSSLTLPASCLDRQLPASNRELAIAQDRVLSKFTAKLNRDDIVSCTKSTISEWLPSGNFTRELLASELHMSPRSLQRKLAAEGITYRKVVETVRQELAELYLVDSSYTLLEIGYLIGFSEQSAFSRAFKRWTGLTPQEFRSAA